MEASFSLSQILTSLVTFTSIASVFYGVARNLRKDLEEKIKEMRQDSDRKFMEMHQRFEKQENRIFQLAMGKTFKEILIEERNLEDQLSKKMMQTYDSQS